MIESSDLMAPIAGYDRVRIQSDGDGVRTLVYFQGCPLRCRYCINRTTWDGTGKSAPYTVQQLLREVEIDSLYFLATNGGITFGGGEPLLHTDFIQEFIKRAPHGWNYWVETSLAVPFENVEKIAPYITKFVVDVKTLDGEIYRKYTGGSVELVQENLRKLIRLVGAKRIWVRVPYIAGFMEKEKQRETVKALKKMGVKDMETFDYVIR